MKVSELIKELQQVNQDLDVIITYYREDWEEVWTTDFSIVCNVDNCEIKM